METEYIGGGIKKTLIFSALDTILVLFLTWLWFYMHGIQNHINESIQYTAYITFAFMFYYYAFDRIWKYIK